MPRRLLVPICLLLLSAAPILAQQPRAESDAAISRTLQSLEIAWLNAEKNNDIAAFEKIVADDWTAIAPDGTTLTKAERAAEIRSSHLSSVSAGPMKVRVLGDVAVVTGTDDETAVEGGKRSTTRYVWTDVFARRNGKWQAVASHTSQVK